MVNFTRRSILKASIPILSFPTVISLHSFISSKAYSGISESVNWAGISYLSGGRKQVDLNFTRKALEIKAPGSNQSKANKALLDALSSVNLQDVGLNLDFSGYARGARFGMIFALANELIIKLDKQEDYTDVVLRLVGYNILFNIKKRDILSTFPVRAKYLQSYEGPVNVDLPKAFLEMITGGLGQNDSIASWYTSKLASYPFELKYGGGSFQVVAPIHRDRVRKDCAAIDITVDKISDMIGLAATTAFGDVMKAPIIPFRKSRATGADMLVRFATGSETIGLALPSPDYAVEIMLRGWQFKEEQVTEHRKQVGLAVGMNIRIYETYSNKEIFSQRYRAIHKYLEMVNKDNASSRLSRVYILYEGLVEQAFNAIADVSLRKRLVEGDTRITEDMELSYKLMQEDLAILNKESDEVMVAVPQPF